MSKLFGLELTRNFLRPKNSRTVLKFWQRWHVSFTRFIRDYLLRPLGGFHGSDAVLMRNSIIVFTLTGLWHGARWPLVLWGLLLGLAVGVSLIVNERRRQARRTVAGPSGGDDAQLVGAPEGRGTTTAIRPGARTAADRRRRVWRDGRRRLLVLGLLLASTPLFVAPPCRKRGAVYRGILTLAPGPFELHHWITVTYGVLMVVLIDNHQQRFEADEDRRARARRMARAADAEDVTMLSTWRWQLWTGAHGPGRGDPGGEHPGRRVLLLPVLMAGPWVRKAVTVIGVLFGANLVLAVAGSDLPEPVVYPTREIQLGVERLERQAGDGCIDLLVTGNSVAAAAISAQRLAPRLGLEDGVVSILPGSIASVDVDWMNRVTLPRVRPGHGASTWPRRSCSSRSRRPRTSASPSTSALSPCGAVGPGISNAGRWTTSHSSGNARRSATPRPW